MLRDERSAVTLELDQPVFNAQAGHWSCSFRVRADENTLVEDEAIGSDSLQAVISGIAGLRRQFDGGPLHGFLTSDQAWFQDEIGPGLPRFLPQGLGREFDAHLVEIVDQAVRGRLRELELRNAEVPMKE